ncbi:MAG: hypothetical protein JNK31_03245 [Candidatus Competibacter sp.]|nr:hypothetical protein [Candidatus Competibacter sp.]
MAQVENELNNIIEAERYFDQAIHESSYLESDPINSSKYIEILRIFSGFLNQVGKNDKAIKLFDKASKLDEKYNPLKKI